MESIPPVKLQACLEVLVDIARDFFRVEKITFIDLRKTDIDLGNLVTKVDTHQGTTNDGTSVSWQGSGAS